VSTSTGPRGPTATVVAFDGVVADTLELRARALDEALAAAAARLQLDGAIHAVDSRQAMPGRTFAEAARELLPVLIAGDAHDAPPRETLVDLIAVDAGRRYSNALSNGVSLQRDAGELLSTLAASGRLVARADSARHDVDAMLSLAGLEGAFTFVRCSDDAPRAIGAPSLQGSWLAIDQRLLAAGVVIANRAAIEVAEIALEVARPFAGRVERSRFQ
jgi:beta-phosphoglucomutase-like phosphatase (HAD superfamily)